MTVSFNLTWAHVTAAVGVLGSLVHIYLSIRKSQREDRRDMHRLSDILRRDIYLTYEENAPKRRERFKALLHEINPIRDRLWICRGKPLEKRGE